MITRRGFLKGMGLSAGALAIPSWLILEEPKVEIQTYFRFLKADGRILSRVWSYDSYEIYSFLYCREGKSCIQVMGKEMYNENSLMFKEMKYYYGRAEFSGPFIAQIRGEKDPEARKECIKVFNGEIRRSRNELEEFIKKAEGTKNIWVYSDDGPKLLKRI